MCDFADIPWGQGIGPEDMAREWCYVDRACKMLQQKRDALEAMLLHHRSQGHQFEAVEFTPTTGSTRWKIPVAQIASMGKALGLQLLKPAEPITPKQAIKLGAPEEFVIPFTVHKSNTTIQAADPDRLGLVFSGVLPQ